ncbi:MAG: DUF2332 domain-containing protein [Actinobacteria bacterium]|nr:DUF2332 domain-containing protein [Actinomycetota bacterium]
MEDQAALARRFRDFGRATSKASPLYGHLSLAIAEDPNVIELLRVAPAPQQIPVLLFAAVHDLLLRGLGSELAAYYPNLTVAVAEGDPYPIFRQVALDHREVLLQTIATRNTQTNEVGRCAYFLPVFAIVADEVGPLAHLDVGTSAGLNLAWPKFSYRYDSQPIINSGSIVVVDCSTRGAPPLPKQLPQLARAIGLDVAPIDVADEEAVRWLEACVWPDQPRRFSQLIAAIEIARSSPPDVRAGDAVIAVGKLIDELAEYGHPLVTTSWVLNYLGESGQRAFVAAVDEVGARCDLSWVVAESPAQTPGLPIPGAPDEEITVLSLVTWRRGRRVVRRLATAHPHGAWMNWE